MATVKLESTVLVSIRFAMLDIFFAFGLVQAVRHKWYEEFAKPSKA